jgi:hypothetical protein
VLALSEESEVVFLTDEVNAAAVEACMRGAGLLDAPVRQKCLG